MRRKPATPPESHGSSLPAFSLVLGGCLRFMQEMWEIQDAILQVIHLKILPPREPPIRSLDCVAVDLFLSGRLEIMTFSTHDIPAWISAILKQTCVYLCVKK